MSYVPFQKGWAIPMRLLKVSGLLYGFCFLLSGCAPVFSELQDAKLVGKGEYEVTPSVSDVHFVDDDGESGRTQTHIGVQAAYGLSDETDLRIRYERVTLDTDGSDDWAFNVIGIGPKFQMSKDVSAFSVPVGFAFGDRVEDISETLEAHPTILFTIPMMANFELNPSAKALIPLGNTDRDLLVAFNLGAGLSADYDKWVIRPEVGFLFNPGSSGYFRQFSLGFTLFP